jgi:hypothetical protein
VTIQRLYGHSSPLVTQLYLHPSDRLGKEAVDLLVDFGAENPEKGENLLHIRDTANSSSPRDLPKPFVSIN